MREWLNHWPLIVVCLVDGVGLVLLAAIFLVGGKEPHGGQEEE